MSARPHWPLAKISAKIAQIRNAVRDGDIPTPDTLYVLLTTGAVNPVHRGHIFALHEAASHLMKKYYLNVVGAFISPSSDLYLRGKFQGVDDFFFPASVRYEACVKATEKDDLVDVGAYEISFQDRWPDFPEVAANLQQTLNAAQQSLWSNNKNDAAPKIEVIYCCGSDHFLKCSLQNGIWLGNGLGQARVAVTCRAGDESKLAASQISSNEHDKKVFALPALQGPLAAINSTEIRKALKVLGGTMEPGSIQAVLAMQSQP